MNPDEKYQNFILLIWLESYFSFSDINLKY